MAGPDGEGRQTLERVTYSYLSDWITRQRQDQKEGIAGADARLVAALELQEQLERILEGKPPYDIFVRWKSVGEQPVGWNPDINDGVRLNIRPFMRAELRSGGLKGAGILRTKPNIKWGKDRGKEPQELRDREDFPWFWSCPGAPERQSSGRTTEPSRTRSSTATGGTTSTTRSPQSAPPVRPLQPGGAGRRFPMPRATSRDREAVGSVGSIARCRTIWKAQDLDFKEVARADPPTVARMAVEMAVCMANGGGGTDRFSGWPTAWWAGDEAIRGVPRTSWT